jgi:two-component system cell cycle sensor histidine kinase/response regulator CckA
MDQRSREKLRLYALTALPVLLVAFGWYIVVAQSRSLEKAAIQTYQDAQLEVVESAARAAQVYIEGELARRGDGAVHTIEQEVLVNFVKPIRIGTVGDAWIYSPEYVVFDESEDFPAAYIGKSMAEIFDIQKENGAWHYEQMTEAVMNGREGTGWYVWEPGKAKESAPWWEFLTKDVGREIAAWTPVVVFPGTDQELTWLIGMSAMLPEVMRIDGAYAQIGRSIIIMSIVTVVVFALLFLLRRAETQVKELRQEVQELRIEVDEAKKSKQVSEIVETEYFQDLSARARAMRERKRGTARHDGEQ